MTDRDRIDKLAFELTKLEGKVWEAYRDKNWAILEPTFREVEKGVAHVRACLKRSQEEACNKSTS